MKRNGRVFRDLKWSQLSIAVAVLLQVQSIQVHAESRRINGSTKGSSSSNSNSNNNIDISLFPIEVTPSTGGTVDDLFPTQPRITPGTGSNSNQNGNTGGNSGGSNSNSGGSSSSGGSQKTPGSTGTTVRPSDVKAEFKCSLFENSDYADILSAVNSLNQAVGSSACAGTSINVQNIQDNNKKITDAVKALTGFLENPETVQADSASAIVSNVDTAIRAASSLANTLANTDLMNKSCRDQMSGGQVALALNDIINGLTPYALMATTMTGGTAAVPFVVGGSVITSAISSMNKIVTENSTKIADPQVRRAIIENTCQFIRLDQKYKFLIKNHVDQVSKISQEIANSQNLFSTKVSNLSGMTSSLVNRKNALSTTSMDIEQGLSSASAQLALDKSFVNSTSDDIKICQIGIQLALMTSEQDSYVTQMLDSVDKAMIAYGSNSIAEAYALKFSGQIAISSLKSLQGQQFTINSDFSSCAKATRSLIETVEQSASLSKRIIKLAQDSVDKELRLSPDYNQFQAHLKALNQKQLQAERVTSSLENLRKYANSFAQSEIDAEMDRLRRGLFAQKTLGINSPVMAWFTYTQNLHRSAVKQFTDGLQALRQRAYTMTTSGKNRIGWNGGSVNNERITKDWNDAYQLRVFDADRLAAGSADYMTACREMQDVWGRWVTAVDHLSAIESLCSMIEPYVFDNRDEDKALVLMCRGITSAPTIYTSAKTDSTFQQMKNSLISDYTAGWAVYLKSKIDALSCPQPTM